MERDEYRVPYTLYSFKNNVGPPPYRGEPKPERDLQPNYAFILLEAEARPNKPAPSNKSEAGSGTGVQFPLGHGFVGDPTFEPIMRAWFTPPKGAVARIGMAPVPVK